MPSKPIQDTASYLLVQVLRGHKAQVAQALRKLNLYVGQEMILKELWRRDGLTQSDLANECKLEPPTITKMLDRMKKAGLVQIRSDTQDARVHRVYLTNRGRSLREQVQELWGAVENQLFKDFTDKERAAVDSIFVKMLANLRSESGFDA